MANRYWVGGTGTWDATAGTKWATTSGGAGGAAVPTSADNVFFDANSGAVTVATGGFYTGVCNNLDCTGFTGTLGTGSPGGIDCYGNTFTLVSGMSTSFSSSSTITFRSTSGTTTITTAGKTLPAVTFNGVGGTFNLSGSLTSLNTIGVTNGTFDTGGFDISCYSFSSSNSNVRTINLGASTINMSGSSGAVIDFTTSTNLTFNAGTSTVKFAPTGSAAGTFSGGGKTFYNFWVSGSGTGTHTISGSNTFNDFKVDTPPHTVVFTAGTTQTVSTFTVNGTSGNLVTIRSSSAGSPFVLSKSSGVVSCDYLSVKDSTASGAIWKANFSTNVSGNTGWIFTGFTPVSRNVTSFSDQSINTTSFSSSSRNTTTFTDLTRNIQ